MGSGSESEDGDGSITHLLMDLKGGANEAAADLWNRYFAALVRLAERRLRGSNRSLADQDGEDAALSAFVSFVQGVERRRFPKLDDREDLWRVLVVITARKATKQIERSRREKRGGGRVRLESELFDEDVAAGLDAVIGNEPTPEFAAMVAEEYQHMLDRLPDDALRRIAVRKMEGCTGPEIAGELGCSLRLVGKKLQLIRKIWESTPP